MKPSGASKRLNDTDWITTLDDLDARYGQPGQAATIQVTTQLSPAYRI